MTDEMDDAEARFIAAQREYEEAFEALEGLRIARGQEPLSAQLKRMALEDLPAEDLATGLDSRGEQGGDGQGDGDSGGDALLHDDAPSVAAEVADDPDLTPGVNDDEPMTDDVVKVVRIATIQSAALARCPTHVLVPSHYRLDGSCLHDLREREPVVFHAGFLDQDVREAYNGQKAIILKRVESDRLDGPDFLIEFESGNRLTVFANEVTPDDA